jgi:lysozyme family protein
MSIEKHIDRIIAAEGGYVDHPDDSGGPTIYGITKKIARDHGYSGEMQDMPLIKAKDIYASIYYVKPGFHLVAEFSEKVAFELFDTGVNMGPRCASVWFQRSLNALNRKEELYPDIAIDGQAGRKTCSAFAAFLRVRESGGERVMLKALNCLQGAKYISLTERRRKDESFLFGWLMNRVEL